MTINSRIWDCSFDSLGKPLARVQPEDEIYPLFIQTEGQVSVGTVPITQCMHNIFSNPTDGTFKETTHTICVPTNTGCREGDHSHRTPFSVLPQHRDHGTPLLLWETPTGIRTSSVVKIHNCNTSYTYSQFIGMWYNTSCPDVTHWIRRGKSGCLMCSTPEVSYTILTEVAGGSILCWFFSQKDTTWKWLQKAALSATCSTFFLTGDQDINVAISTLKPPVRHKLNANENQTQVHSK